MVRAIEGHGLRMISSPPLPSGTGRPSFVTISGTIPKKGRVAEPGLVGTAPGIGEIMIAPVSVCQKVSTMGQRSLPIMRWYHIHDSGLIGSPTVPSRRSDASEYFSTHSLPHFVNARI